MGWLDKYQEGGVLPYQDPEFIYKDRFNTPLSPQEVVEFNKWTSKNPKALGDMGAYDVQGFWKSGDYLKTDAQGHGSDRWKKPNHPTFSNESIYHGNGFYGGSWGKDGSYYPTRQTRELYDEEYYNRLFGREPERPEHLNLSKSTNLTPSIYENGGVIAQGGKNIPLSREIDAITSESAPYWQIPIKQRQDFRGNFLYNRLSGKEDRYAKQPDLVRYYGGRPLEGNYLKHSQYKPSISENPNAEYITIDSDKFREDIVNRYNENINDTLPGGKLRVKPDGTRLSGDLGNFTIGKGNDEKGQYLSYYDIYNYTRDDNPDVNKSEWFGAVKPYEIYDRIYVEKNEEGKYVAKKFTKGGEVKYTPEYIEQLKRFENKPDNLAYHLDNKKIPTIGWGHRITKEELERKAIKMGKEWVPYERFSGKEGRILADKLMEQDVAHHYNRLERQVGKDTLATLPPEVHDVLLDITYNRGSLGDSLEYVKSGDIAGLRDYLAETSKGLKGGAKTRMEWRANRIPVKTLPPVEAPINYNVENQYVPEVLQSIAEQPSTQSIIPIQDNEGYRNQENYGKPVQITSNQSRTPISMDQVPFPILAMSDTGELKIMMPGEEHEFEGGSVTELPMGKNGGVIKSNQLRTFTKDIGWLSKYKEQ